MPRYWFSSWKKARRNAAFVGFWNSQLESMTFKGKLGISRTFTWWWKLKFKSLILAKVQKVWTKLQNRNFLTCTEWTKDLKNRSWNYIIQDFYRPLSHRSNYKLLLSQKSKQCQQMFLEIKQTNNKCRKIYDSRQLF